MKVVQLHRRIDRCQLDQGSLTMTSYTKHAHDDEGNEVLQQVSAIRFNPSSERAGSSFVALFAGEIDHYQKIVLHPTIMAYRNVPSNSKVFQLVEEDDLEGFKRLLLAQEATTRDCDENGISLLGVSDSSPWQVVFACCRKSSSADICQYACSFASPLCCKFLIESGADVNRVEPNM